MKHLWCPWRLEYILGPKPDECVFCIPEESGEDKERLILYRGKWNFVIMNKYPYNNGHLMVTPYRHLMQITDLTKEESTEQFDLIISCTAILKKHYNAAGINIGLNLGEAAGAGIREHMHFHVLPRWFGDSSFMAIMDNVRIMPEYLADSYMKLKPYFDKLA